MSNRLNTPIIRYKAVKSTIEQIKQVNEDLTRVADLFSNAIADKHRFEIEKALEQCYKQGLFVDFQCSYEHFKANIATRATKTRNKLQYCFIDQENKKEVFLFSVKTIIDREQSSEYTVKVSQVFNSYYKISL